MKLFNLIVDREIHLAADNGTGIRDLTAAGFPLTMDMLIRSNALSEADSYLDKAPMISNPVFSDIVNTPGKLICVGLNYRKHAEQAKMQTYNAPALFSKFSNALVPCGAEVELPPWEVSYDYEAELVIVIGKEAWGVPVEDAAQVIFGYTCGNDLSCRDAQKRSGHWLIGKTMPGLHFKDYIVQFEQK